jgi:casein kinase 1
VLDIKQSKLLIVKKQKRTSNKYSTLQNEHNVLEELSQCKLFAQVSQMKQSGQSEYFMMDCFGGDLEHLVDKYGPFGIGTVKYIGHSILKRLEIMHSKGYLHRDIKT